jgi:hypothetical protein
MEMSFQLYTLPNFTPGERPSGTPLIGGWVGPRANLDSVVKRKEISALAGKQNLVAQPVSESLY